MEPGREPEAPSASEDKPGEPESASSFQARLWKNLQLGGKGSKVAAERRSAETSPSLPRPAAAAQPPGKGDLVSGGKWGGFRRRKHVLDRVISSSQPNLCCSSAEPLEAGSSEAGSALRRLREHFLHHHPPGRGQPPASSSSASSSACSSPLPPPAPARAGKGGGDGPPGAGTAEEARRPGAHLSHQKSSSLPGTTCLEQLLQESPTKGKAKGAQGGGGGSSSPAVSPRPNSLGGFSLAAGGRALHPGAGGLCASGSPSLLDSTT